MRNLEIRDLVQYPEGGIIELGVADSTNNIFFNRELEHLIPELIETELAKHSARMIMPVDMSFKSTAKRITYRQMTRVGAAKIISDYANDVPLVNLYREEFTGNVRTLAAGAQYSIDEIEEAQEMGVSLPTEDAYAAKEAIDKLENDIAFEGDATHGLVGLLTAANVPQTTVANPGSGTTWAVKTGVQMGADMFACIDAIPAATAEVENPTELWIAPNQYRLASRTQYNAGTDTTVLEYFKRNAGNITAVRPVRELDGAGPGGEDMMIACEPVKSKFRLCVVMEITAIPEQAKQLAIQVIWRKKTGGVRVIKPLSIHKCIGI